MPKVTLFANLRKIAGMKEVWVNGENVREVMTALCDRFPDIEMTKPNMDILWRFIVTVNGHPTWNLDSLVSEHDEIAIFPPLGGG